MHIKYIILVNKQGQTRLCKYYGENQPRTAADRSRLEGELIRRCLVRQERQCNFFSKDGVKIVYRRYASLYFIVGVLTTGDASVNELEVLEMIHNMVETLDKYFDNICELDIMFNIEKVHLMIDEMVEGWQGRIGVMNRNAILQTIHLMDKFGGTVKPAGIL